MVKYIVKIDGMMCGHCEAHVNDAIRNNFSVKSVSSSRTKKETEIIAEKELDEAKIESVIKETGYTFLGITKEPYVKKGLFSK